MDISQLLTNDPEPEPQQLTELVSPPPRRIIHILCGHPISFLAVNYMTSHISPETEAILNPRCCLQCRIRRVTTLREYFPLLQQYLQAPETNEQVIQGFSFHRGHLAGRIKAQTWNLFCDQHQLPEPEEDDLPAETLKWIVEEFTKGHTLGVARRKERRIQDIMKGGFDEGWHRGVAAQMNIELLALKQSQQNRERMLLESLRLAL